MWKKAQFIPFKTQEINNTNHILIRGHSDKNPGGESDGQGRAGKKSSLLQCYPRRTPKCNHFSIHADIICMLLPFTFLSIFMKILLTKRMSDAH